jgi:outer membrane protein OmpA-like peptidoglycan-associated protein
MIATTLATAGIAEANPKRSQNPRVGQLAELAFAPGAAELPITQREVTQHQLGKVAAWAFENPEGVVVIDGHADREGDRAANVRLSMARARAVRDQLVEVGVDIDRIVIAAYGEKRAKRSVVIWGTRGRAPVATTRAPRPQRVTFR